MRRLNVGCGRFPMADWINLDANPEVAADIHAHVPPLPFADGEMDEIYAGHLLEHLTRDEADEFARECYRCLKPGGKLGLLVPDTREIMRRWLDGAVDCVEIPEGVWRNIADLDQVCAVFIHSIVQETPHRWMYDRDTLARVMVNAGFRHLKEIDRYRDPRIAAPAWYQVGVEGVRE